MLHFERAKIEHRGASAETAVGVCHSTFSNSAAGCRVSVMAGNFRAKCLCTSVRGTQRIRMQILLWRRKARFPQGRREVDVDLWRCWDVDVGLWRRRDVDVDLWEYWE